MKKHLLLILTLSSLTFAQMTFQWKNPLSTGENLNSIYVTSNTVFSVGSYGEIIKSIDGGYNWSHIITPYSNELFNIKFSNSNPSVGIITGANGIILRTEDASSSWQRIQSGTTESLTGLTFFNSTVFISGSGGVILKSTDAGQSFTSLNTGTKNLINGIHFPISNIGYAIAGDVLLKTLNGGLSWTQTRLNGFSPYDESEIYFLTEKIGFIASSAGKLLRTDDGGVTFIQLVTNLNDQFTEITFINENVGYVLATQEIIKTIDGGKTWNKTFQFPFGYCTKSLSASNENTILTCGLSGQLMKSTDGGNSFLPVSKITITDLSEIRALKNNSKFLWANGNSATGSTLINSYDAGENWVANENIITKQFCSIAYSSQSTAIAISRTGKIYTTKDNFQNVVEVSNPAGVWLKKIITTNNGTAFCIGNSGVILRSNDFGNSWNVVRKGNAQEDLYDIIFIDETVGYCAGHSGVFKTTDAGNTWQKILDLKSQYVFSIDFYDRNVGAVSTYSDSLYISTDSGATWHVSETKTKICYNGVKLLDAKTLLACGSFGYVLLSKDLGSTWEKVESNQPFDWNSLCALGASIFLCGDGGRIKKSSYKTENLISTIHQGKVVQSDYSLEQNYPNPFNPTTEIVYQIPQAGLVSLKIFDLLGKEVETLVHEIQSAGSHTIKFSGAALASGMYFYSIQTDGLRMVKKMCLVK